MSSDATRILESKAICPGNKVLCQRIRRLGSRAVGHAIGASGLIAIGRIMQNHGESVNAGSMERICYDYSVKPLRWFMRILTGVLGLALVATVAAAPGPESAQWQTTV